MINSQYYQLWLHINILSGDISFYSTYSREATIVPRLLDVLGDSTISCKPGLQTPTQYNILYQQDSKEVQY